MSVLGAENASFKLHGEMCIPTFEAGFLRRAPAKAGRIARSHGGAGMQ
ncbi:MAG: hypothetical protein KDD85_06745 [Parvularculaceae bacterium]|nr:hypothetical protein [Parvularculaceae bacterium]